ncbi:MAG: hypothetical protein AAF311_08170 [Pseudomonadota bacterium]
MSDIRSKIYSIDPATSPNGDPSNGTRSTDLDVEGGTSGQRAASNAGTLGLRVAPQEPTPIFRSVVPLVEPVGAAKPRKLTDTAITFDNTDEWSGAGVPVSETLATPALETRAERPARIGWIGLVFTLLTGLSLAAMIVAYLAVADEVGPLGLAALIMASTVPMIAVVTFWAGLRTFAETRHEAMRLREIADRLMRADDTVANDVSKLSSAIRRELALVDSRLAQTRSEVETLAAVLERNSADTDGLTRRIAEKTDLIARLSRSQREALSEVAEGIDQQIAALNSAVDRTAASLSETAQAAAEQVSGSSDALGRALDRTSTHKDEITSSADEAARTLGVSEQRLSVMSETLRDTLAELESLHAQYSDQSRNMSEQLSDDKAAMERALHKQSDLLSAVDAQIEMTEARLTSLVDHARDIQDQLTARLSDIDTTLGDADRRSRAFTADIADRVSDSVAQTRRELSIMEGEIRSLNDRMETARSELAASPPEAVSAPATEEPLPIGRLHITPLEGPGETSDAPQTFADDLSIPDIEAEPFAVPEILKPQAALEAPQAAPEIVTRPGFPSTEDGPVAQTAVAPPDPDWRWRDMLGTIEPIAPLQDESVAPTRAVERPGPGVPLPAPPRKPELAEGSDVVARLCEVRLPPSSVVEQSVIEAAHAARLSGGEAAQSATVFQTLNAPVIHLRGVLSADLEFRLRAESFRRSFDSYLDGLPELSAQRAELFTANGRAYLLCAAALSAG